MVSVRPVLDPVGDFANLLVPDTADDDFAVVRDTERTGPLLATADFVVANLERLLGRPIATRAPARRPILVSPEHEELLLLQLTAAEWKCYCANSNTTPSLCLPPSLVVP